MADRMKEPVFLSMLTSAESTCRKCSFQSQQTAGAEVTNLTGLTVQALLIHPATGCYLYCQFKGNIKPEFKAVKLPKE